MVEAARRLHRRHAAPARRPDLDGTGSGWTRWPGSSSSIRRTSRGWNETRWLDTSTFRARWLIARRALQKHASTPTTRAPADRPPADPDKLVDLALGWWGVAACLPQTRERDAHLRAEDDGRRGRRRRPPEVVPAHDLQRAPPPRGRLAGDADRMSDCHHCNEFSRVDAPSARRRRGRAGPSRDRAGHAGSPRAPGSTAARSSPARSAPH